MFRGHWVRLPCSGKMICGFLVHTARISLFSQVHSCCKCPRMANSRRVLTDLNGTWDARVVFVAEAPGRLGAEVTGVPLFGDRTGDRFEELLRHMGWSRSDIFITNAVLCNPRDENGNNDTPKRIEIVNCATLLKKTIDVVNPELVVALGRSALESLKLIEAHGFDLRTSTGTLRSWYGRKLAVLYHPGPRTAVHRSWQQQIEDAVSLSKMAAKLLGLPMPKTGTSQKAGAPQGQLCFS